MAFLGFGNPRTILTVLSRRRRIRYVLLVSVLSYCCLSRVLQTLELIPLYSKIAPQDSSLAYQLPEDSLSSTEPGSEEFDFDASLTIFSETKALDLTNKFRRDADAYYVEAKRSTVASVAQIPFWMYGVLVVLGWNEFMMVLFNPLYFMFLLLAGAGAYIIVQLGLAGPLLQVGGSMAAEVRTCVCI